MPRFHAALGIVSPANATGTEASRPSRINPRTNNRAYTLMKFPPELVHNPISYLEKRYSTFVWLEYKSHTRSLQQPFTTETQRHRDTEIQRYRENLKQPRKSYMLPGHRTNKGNCPSHSLCLCVPVVNAFSFYNQTHSHCDTNNFLSSSQFFGHRLGPSSPF